MHPPAAVQNRNDKHLVVRIFHFVAKYRSFFSTWLRENVYVFLSFFFFLSNRLLTIIIIIMLFVRLKFGKCLIFALRSLIQGRFVNTKFCAAALKRPETSFCKFSYVGGCKMRNAYCMWVIVRQLVLVRRRYWQQCCVLLHFFLIPVLLLLLCRPEDDKRPDEESILCAQAPVHCRHDAHFHQLSLVQRSRYGVLQVCQCSWEVLPKQDAWSATNWK